ncbi:MAG: MraY family glycosyltransferase, partial [Bacteroidota bacterium]
YALLAFSMAGSLIAYMIFNHHPAKIFMGDSGSLMIGLINAILVIKFINIADNPSTVIRINSVVAVAFAILIVPLLDTLRVFGIRIFNAKSPFTPDRNHVHHLLLDNGLSHPAVTFTCVAINIGFIILAWLGRSLGPNYLMLIMLVLSFSGLGLLYYRKSRRKMVIAKSESGTTELKTVSRVVTLTKETPAADQK